MMPSDSSESTRPNSEPTDGDQHAFEEQLNEDAANRQANQPQHADRGAPFVDQHDGERQEEHGGGDDRDDRDGQVKSPQHDERAGRLGRADGRLRLTPGMRAPDVA